MKFTLWTNGIEPQGGEGSGSKRTSVALSSLHMLSGPVLNW